MVRSRTAAAWLTACVGMFAHANFFDDWMESARAEEPLEAARPGNAASYESHGKTIGVEVFRPIGDARRPAVLLLHGADCLQAPLINAGYRLGARRLAQHGYVVLLIHYMDRTGTKRTDTEDMTRNFVSWMETIRDGITYAQTRNDVDGERIGIVGASLGGSLALCVGGTDARVKAVVEYFGGLPEPAVPLIKQMPPVLILHGDADRLVNVQEAYKLEKVLQEKGVPYEMHIYPGQGHGLLGASADAAARTVSFLDKHLKSAHTVEPPGPNKK